MAKVYGDSVDAYFEAPSVTIAKGCAATYYATDRGSLKHEEHEGEGTLLIVSQHMRVAWTTKVSFFSAVLEFPGELPVGVDLDAKTHLKSVLYHFGAHRLAYESNACDGRMSFELQPSGSMDCRLLLHFHSPLVDETGARSVDQVDWRFEISAEQLASPRGPRLKDD